MLSSSHCTSSLVLCSTCRLSQADRKDALGRTGGELFAQAVAAVLAVHVCVDRIALQTMPCLFACSSNCTAYLRSSGRIGYVFGRFEPSARDASALLDYVAQYLETPDGVVPYANWPDGVKGHFMARIPPDGLIWNVAST